MSNQTNWRVNHIISNGAREETFPLRHFHSLSEALEYMATNGVVRWIVADPRVELMRLVSSGSPTYEITYTED